VDIKPKRLWLALELGATHTIDHRRQDVASRIAHITGRGVDYVVETTANWEMHGLVVEVLNPHGIVALLTGQSGTDALPEGPKIIAIIQGDAVPKRFIPRLIKRYQAGLFPFDRLLKFYNFKDINRALADAKRGNAIKPLLRIGKM